MISPKRLKNLRELADVEPFDEFGFDQPLPYILDELLDEINRLKKVIKGHKEYDDETMAYCRSRAISKAAEVAKNWPCSCPTTYPLSGKEQYHGTDCENETGRFIAEKILELKFGES